ncbi:MAG TPA: hypothetical protein VGR51_11070 [Thermoplasmata archaeon]|jgi:hypothetical protein|nr:hypothetical protein [Thermoplasmata archaeon]
MSDEEVAQKNVWANRFVVAAIVEGLLAVVLTGYLLYQGIFGVPAASRIVAGGGAGTWLTVGYFVFIIMGPIGMAMAAGMFRQLESHMHRTARGWQNFILWPALLLYNVGVVGGTWLMMHAGYRGGAAALPVNYGGLGWSGANAGLVHTQIMQFYPPYIAAFLAAALLGAFLGLVGYVLVWARPAKVPTKPKATPA